LDSVLVMLLNQGSGVGAGLGQVPGATVPHHPPETASTSSAVSALKLLFAIMFISNSPKTKLLSVSPLPVETSLNFMSTPENGRVLAGQTRRQINMA